MIDAYGLSDQGRARPTNEDTFAVTSGLGLAVVADGMGGHRAGEVASALAVETLRRFVERVHREADLTWPFGIDGRHSLAVNCLGTGIRLANARILHEATTQARLAGMGTTIVAVLVRDSVTSAWVGDSRAYLIRGGRLQPLTRDHSWIEAAVASGLVASEDRHTHPMAHGLTRALGTTGDVEVDVGEAPLEAGDRILLCSDGLTAILSDARIAGIVGAHEDTDLRGACEALIEATNAAGGPDNVTAVLVRPRRLA